MRNNFKNDVMRKHILTQTAQGNLCRVRLQIQSFRTWDTRTINTWPRSCVFFTKLLVITEGNSTFSMEAFTTCVDMENVHVFVGESRQSSWTELSDEFGYLQEHEFRGDWKFIQYLSDVDIGTQFESSSPSWTRSVLSHDQVGQSNWWSMKKNPMMITRFLKKVHFHSHWKRNQDAVHWIKLSRAQDRGLQFSQTRSFAIITLNLVPGDCISSIVRKTTPRPAPNVTL